MNGNYVSMLVVTVTLLIFMYINHSRETERCKIIKLGLYFLLVNEVFAVLRAQVLFDIERYPTAVVYLLLVAYHLSEVLVSILVFMYLLTLFPAVAENKRMLQTVFFVCVSVAAIAIITTPITGIIYRLDYHSGGSVVFSGGYKLFYIGRLVLLAVFLAAVIWKKSEFPSRQFENMVVVLSAVVLMHCIPLVSQMVYAFGLIANTFFGMVYWLFHSAGYEENRAHMGADFYGRELAYRLDKKQPFYVFEISVANCDYLMRRGCLSKEELLGIYGTLFEKMNLTYRSAMVFCKEPGCTGVIADGLSQEEAGAMAGQLKEWMQEFFGGSLTYRIIGISCPQYGENPADVEYLLRLLRKKCAENSIYFCSGEDFDEFDARDDVLLYLQNICTEKQDMVLFGSPMIDKKSSLIERFEIFGRAQMVGGGIVGSHRITEIAQQYGYSHDVNMAVLKKICEYLTAAGSVDMKVSLRISSDELERPGFASDVLDIIRNYDLVPETIGFEVRMAPGQRDIEGMFSVMQLLRENGIIFLLTDFSTSSVNFESITGLPFKTVKFESKCARQAAEDTKSFDVTGLLVDMLKDRGYDVVFKGIEDEELEEIALSLGADYLEGTRYAKPLPLEEIADWLDLGAMY